MIEANRYLVFWIQAFCIYGVACCVTHFKLRFSWEQCLNRDFSLLRLLP